MLLAIAWWESAGGRLIWSAAVFAAVGVLSRSKPAKWLWRTLVTDPLSHWGRGIVAEVVDEKVVQPNGGSSLRDVVDALAVQQETLLAWTSEAEGRQSDWAEYVGQQFDTIGSRMDMLCDEVGRLKHERKDVA